MPTQHTQTLPSHPTLRQGGCSYISSIHHRPSSLRAHVRHIPCRYKSPLPLSSGGGVGVTICHFTRQYLFVPSLNLSAMVSPASRYSLYELGRWVLINTGSITGQAWVDSPKLDCVAWNLNLSLSCPPVTNTHTHNHPHLSLPVSGQGRQWDNGRVDLGLSITAPVNASTCQRLDRANKPLPSHAHNAFPSPTVLRGWQLILAISLSVYDCV